MFRRAGSADTFSDGEGRMSTAFAWIKIRVLPQTLCELLLLSTPQLSACKTGIFVTFTCAAEVIRSKNGCGDAAAMDAFELGTRICCQPGCGADCFCVGSRSCKEEGRCLQLLSQLSHWHLAASPCHPSATHGHTVDPTCTASPGSWDGCSAKARNRISSKGTKAAGVIYCSCLRAMRNFGRAGLQT